jgi:broad specificity phosphatase PhoE
VSERPETTLVHFLRHGEVHNPGGVLYGRLPDYHLSETGTEMAKAVAAWFAGRDVAAVVASPLERAQETARPVADEFDLPLHTDLRLTEAGNVFEGQTFGVGTGSFIHPVHWWHLRNPARPSWGEPYREVAKRVLAAAADARDFARGHEVVLVSHQLPIWVVRSVVERRSMLHDPRRRQCSLASLTTLTYAGDDVVALSYTEPAAHLVPLAPGATFSAGA